MTFLQMRFRFLQKKKFAKPGPRMEAFLSRYQISFHVAQDNPKARKNDPTSLRKTDVNMPVRRHRQPGSRKGNKRPPALRKGGIFYTPLATSSFHAAPDQCPTPA
ncbi:hypothetical protein AD947_04190 [Acetobacter tropicalis]|uniref:Uncharacterized protein n=1 Tax=Acetobacter tropicalis TaxID=104102 RepID=A0A149U1V5_9PROT|nr:hypothetical protein AD947_04190 [Acetobacter tropicalis]